MVFGSAGSGWSRNPGKLRYYEKPFPKNCQSRLAKVFSCSIFRSLFGWKWAALMLSLNFVSWWALAASQAIATEIISPVKTSFLRVMCWSIPKSLAICHGNGWSSSSTLWDWGIVARNYDKLCFLSILSRWWFQIFFIFTPTWGRFPFWLIFFRWVETTK